MTTPSHHRDEGRTQHEYDQLPAPRPTTAPTFGVWHPGDGQTARSEHRASEDLLRNPYSEGTPLYAHRLLVQLQRVEVRIDEIARQVRAIRQATQA